MLVLTLRSFTCSTLCSRPKIQLLSSFSSSVLLIVWLNSSQAALHVLLLGFRFLLPLLLC